MDVNNPLKMYGIDPYPDWKENETMKLLFIEFQPQIVSHLFAK